MLERAKAVTRRERWTAFEYARFADDLVILVDSHPRQQWLRQAVEKRLREELAKLQVEVNEEKSRTVDLQRGESFGFLGFEFRRVRSRRGRWMPLLLPKGKKRTALLGKLKEIFRASRSQPVGGVIEKINPILRGWVKYFAIGHSSRCFSFIRNWVEMKIRRHLARACQRQGFGWKRWSREWLYGTLGLFSEYRVSYHAVDLGSRSSLIGPITLDVKCAGARSAGNPHATCDVAGAGNQFTVRLVRHSQRKRGATDRPDLRNYGASPRPSRGSDRATQDYQRPLGKRAHARPRTKRPKPSNR